MKTRLKAIHLKMAESELRDEDFLGLRYRGKGKKTAVVVFYVLKDEYSVSQSNS